MFRKLSLVGMLALVVGCSSSATTTGGSTGSSTGSSTAGSVADSASTTAASATTVPASTAPAPTTTVAPDPLILRSDGLGPFDFGRTPTDVIDAITTQLGAPARNDVLLYEDASHLSDGYYESLVGPYYYDLAFPVGQTVCWTGDFCAEFGGASEPDLHFIGWWYTGPAHMLASASNLTISAQWDDFPSMIVGATCYTTGGGSHHGIQFTLNVAGGWDWLVSDGLGGYVESLPDRHAAVVDYMWAGQQPFQFGLDC